MAKPTPNTDESKEREILEIIFEHAKVDSSFIEQLQEVLEGTPEKAMNRLREIVE